ncbi:formate dehydrogenase accessory sulfurtransferase FdhD [Phytoactinopolyspora alkaliphila]|uniref:Sulfur carrier protein FdhD n=2 Tax=Phytoactinopolyspora alkaliphila TaxID=1783498 RepID=A0A6N9YT07_9ACTN|nr:formate dehydrogenase accessory sulfurtransferase FdhD [Phytoactinopolyspora alkaliphila]NED98095.1 formate dehydrogenase accessory sulfurtransferase FdhD [Phytoactinopolyspora alkaliphila]
MTTRQPVLRLRAGRAARRPDSLAVEEPLMVRVGGEAVTLTMRTPGHDFDLIAGWLVSEGSVAVPGDIVTMRMCKDEDNTVEVSLAPAAVPPRPRAFATSSACGVCGADSIEAVRTAMRWPVAGDDTQSDVGILSGLPDLLRSEQKLFDRTGGLHAAGLFTATGQPLVVREDVGRHNAVDKVVGSALRAGLLPLRGHVLQVSGRASFELVHKAAAAGIPVMAAVSAPSSLAVELAEDCGITLLGFVRGGGMNVYTHQERVRVGPIPRQRELT